MSSGVFVRVYTKDRDPQKPIFVTLEDEDAKKVNQQMADPNVEFVTFLSTKGPVQVVAKNNITRLEAEPVNAKEAISA